MDEHRFFRGQPTKMMQHVVSGQVGHRHGRCGLQSHALWNADDAVGRAHQMARVRAGARHGDDAIAHVEVLDTIPEGRNGPRSLVSGRVGVRRPGAVQAKPLQQIREVDARIGHVNGHLAGTRRGCFERLHAHGVRRACFGEHQAFGHGQRSKRVRLNPPSNRSWGRQNGFQRVRRVSHDEHLIPRHREARAGRR